jgi:hypothetical protein
LSPGVSTQALAQGHYCFKTLSDANLRVVHGGAETHVIAFDKDNDPRLTPDVPNAKGDEPDGEFPTLTIE